MAREFEPVRLKVRRNGGLRPISEIQGPVCFIPDREQKARDNADRFRADLDIVGELLVLSGTKTAEQVKKEKEEALRQFEGSDRPEQVKNHGVIIELAEFKLSQRFDSHLSLLESLLKEESRTTDEIEDTKRTWKGLFQNQPRRERLGVVKYLQSEAEGLLMQRVPLYIHSLGEFLTDTGKSDVLVEGEVAVWEKRYEEAPEESKPFVAKALRERAKRAPGTEFNNLLLDYRILIAFRIISPDKRGYIAPEDWLNKSREIENPDQQIDLIRALRYVVSKNENKLRMKLVSVPIESSF